MTTRVSVIVYKGKAYISTDSEIDRGVYMLGEPVRLALNLDDLTQGLADAVVAGNPPGRRPLGKYDARQDPILRATRARSWTALAHNGASYGLFWRVDEITLSMSRLDEKGRFVNDPDKFKRFPPDTPLTTIAEAIVADIDIRPEVK